MKELLKPAVLIFVTSCSAGCQNQVSDVVFPGYAGSQKELRDVREGCESKFSSGEISTYAERAECINSGRLKVSNKYSIPFYDISIVSNAYRLAIAKRLDDKQITLKQAKIIMGGAGYIFNAEEDNRRFSKGAYPKERWKTIEQIVRELNQQPNTILKDKIICRLESDTVICD